MHYYAMDLHETLDGEIKILDIHSNSDIVSVLNNAGYKPSKERIERFVKTLASQRRNGTGTIIYSHSGSPFKIWELPTAVEEFYASLPAGTAHLEWKDKVQVLDKRIRNTPLSKQYWFTEIGTLRKAARNERISLPDNALRFGYSPAYTKEGVSFQEFDEKNKTFTERITIPYEQVGLIVLNNSTLRDYPTRKEMRNIPLVSPIETSYPLNPEVPRWMFRNMTRKNTLFPEEVFIGMGADGDRQHQFYDKLLQRKGTFAAVRKNLLMHCGVGVQYLTIRDVKELRRNAPRKDQAVVQAVSEMIVNTIPYTEQDNARQAFRSWWGEEEKTDMFPVAELGMASVQEFIDPKPILATMTGKYHKGTIRAIFYDGALLGAVHRLPLIHSEEFVPLTLRDVHTFYERCSDQLEERIAKAILPVLADFEHRKLTPPQVDRLSRKTALKEIFKE